MIPIILDVMKVVIVETVVTVISLLPRTITAQDTLIEHMTVLDLMIHLVEVMVIHRCSDSVARQALLVLKMAALEIILLDRIRVRTDGPLLCHLVHHRLGLPWTIE